MESASTGKTSTPPVQNKKRRLSESCYNAQDASTPKSTSKKRVRFASEIQKCNESNEQISVDDNINQSPATSIETSTPLVQNKNVV
jgi:hypothetical protein